MLIALLLVESLYKLIKSDYNALYHYFNVDDDIDKDFLDSAKTLFDNIFMDLEGDRHFPIASEVIHEFEVRGQALMATRP